MPKNKLLNASFDGGGSASLADGGPASSPLLSPPIVGETCGGVPCEPSLSISSEYAFPPTISGRTKG